MAASELSNEKKLGIGLIVVVLAVAVLWVGHDVLKSKAVENAGCAMGAAAVGTLSMALSKGRTADEVLKIAGAPVAGAACASAVDELMDNKSATIKIKTDTGSVTKKVTRPQLTAPIRPRVAPRAVQCRGWTSQLLYQMCLDGEIAPRR